MHIAGVLQGRASVMQLPPHCQAVVLAEKDGHAMSSHLPRNDIRPCLEVHKGGLKAPAFILPIFKLPISLL